MSEGSRVELDTAELERGARQLARGIARAAGPVALESATEAAGKIRTAMPKKSGTAAGSVRAQQYGTGVQAEAGVTAGAVYFGWLNWGGTHGRAYVSAGRYTGPATEGAARRFHAACMAAAAQEIRKL